MRLLLHHDGDPTADWLARGLAARGRPVTCVRHSQLVRATRWEQRHDGSLVQSEVVPAGSGLVRSGALRVVLNRLSTVVMDGLPVAPDDRTYAAAELFALWLSWLASLPCPVLNPASPAGLCGPWPPEAEWRLHAARAGLPTDPVAVAPVTGPAPTNGVAVLAACGAVFGPRSAASVADGCRALAEQIGVELLEVWFAAGPDGLRFTGASVVPDLRRGGTALLDHLCRVVR